MSNDKKTMEDVRNLIVCDTQFGWTGSTTLPLQQMLALQERGWLAEGAENNEFDLTDAGRDVVARALQSAVQPTLADVQPGGRVRLATVPYDRARDLIGDAYNAGIHGIGYSQQAMELHDAIIPAQPSPGGQGDAWDIAELVRTDLDRQSCPDAYMRIAMESVVKHLAARQPVETQLGYTLSDVHEAYSRGKRDAARQPVGDHLAQDRKMVSQPVGEPVVIAHRVHYLDGVTGKEIAVSPWMDGDGSEFNVIYAAENPTTRWIENAYAAPAQAVDLGPVRDVFRRWHANELNSTDAMLALVEALAFIDSQAVGK